MEQTANVKLYLVEAAYGDRHHEITTCENSRHGMVRINSNAWVKENLINVGVQQLFPRDWKYMAWLDTDIFFRDPHWAQEALHQLQHFNLIQPWSQCADLGHHGNINTLFNSFGYLQQAGIPIQKHQHDPYRYGHSGFGYCATRLFWENLPRGLMDFCVLGSADWHMAWAAAGEVDVTLRTFISHSYNRRAREWQHGAMKTTHGQIGFCQGRLEHKFHGAKPNRKYKERNGILIECGFDPDKHLAYDAQGVIHIVGNKKLEHEIHQYNLNRKEDSID